MIVCDVARFVMRDYKPLNLTENTAALCDSLDSWVTVGLLAHSNELIRRLSVCPPVCKLFRKSLLLPDMAGSPANLHTMDS